MGKVTLGPARETALEMAENRRPPLRREAPERFHQSRPDAATLRSIGIRDRVCKENSLKEMRDATSFVCVLKSGSRRCDPFKVRSVRQMK